MDPNKDIIKFYLDIGIEEIMLDDLSDNRDVGSFAKHDIARHFADKARTVAELQQMVEKFDLCDLKKSANNTVFSDGAVSSKVMIIGEAPGENEDLRAIPFCGDSGKLLNNMLASIGLSRNNNSYITNMVFWRPPANRKPTDEEISLCRPFVEKHISLINPDLLIFVGSVAATNLLGVRSTMGELRKNIHYYNNMYMTKQVPCFVIFHPSYLLRQSMQKKVAWFDLIKIGEFIIQNKII